MKRLLIDTDTGSDDAVALLMAFRSPAVQVEALTTVSGNVDLLRATRNALYTMELCGARVPVYAGLARPLLREPEYALDIHGADGMGNTNHPAPRAQVEHEHAVPALIRIIRAHPGQITLVTLGPLSNIAAALLQDPGIATLVKEVYIMGGAANCIANVTPSAEFNIYVDPEAARIVFRSGMPMTMIGIELCRGDAVLSPEDQVGIRALNTPYADFILDINSFLQEAVGRKYGVQGIDMPDPVTMAVAMNPALLLRSGVYYVDVETQGDLTRGETVVDRYGSLGQPPTMTVGLEMDGPGFKALLSSLLV